MKEEEAEERFRLLVKSMKQMLPGTTTNYQLEKIGNLLFSSKFKGVFARDQIPRIQNCDCCILNLDSSKEPGSHWVAIVSDRKDVYFFDSFGRKHTTIIPALRHTFRHRNIFQDTSDSNQGKKQVDCGARCMAWLLFYYGHGPRKALLI